MTFAEMIRSLRERAGITQEQLASASGIPLGTLRDYEQGKRRRDPTISTAFRLARALGVSVERFGECFDLEHGKPRQKKTGTRRKK